MEGNTPVPARQASSGRSPVASLTLSLPSAFLQREAGELLRVRSLRFYYCDSPRRARAYATLEPHRGDPLEAAGLELCGEGPDLFAALAHLAQQLLTHPLVSVPFAEREQ